MTESDNVQPEAADTIQNKTGSRVMGLSRLLMQDNFKEKETSHYTSLPYPHARLQVDSKRVSINSLTWNQSAKFKRFIA
jgi:hypothetical protein